MIVARRLDPFEIEPRNVVPDKNSVADARHDLLEFASYMAEQGITAYQQDVLRTLGRYDLSLRNINDGSGGGEGAGSDTGEFFDYCSDETPSGYGEDFDNYMIPYASDTGECTE